MSITTLDEGWALRRNGSCLPDIEKDCGATVSPFRACCPKAYGCPATDNVACCKPGTSCADTLPTADKPRCANATWDLFDNGGYFCCEHGLKGYDRGNSDVCASNDTVIESDYQRLSIVSVGIVPTEATGTPTPSAEPKHSDPSASSNSSSTPTGAIVGGVIGGVVVIAVVVFLAWFLLRRRRKGRTSPSASNAYLLKNSHEVDGSSRPQEVDALQYTHEADGSSMAKYRMDSEQPVHEADGAAMKKGSADVMQPRKGLDPVELPAESVSKA